MIATKNPAVAVAENLWEALRSGFLGTEKTIVEIIKARAWEPLGYETFTDAWVKEVADISIANELLPHVVYQMFAEGLTVDEVAETVKGIGADRAESLDRQRRHGIPAHAASMYEVRPSHAPPPPSRRHHPRRRRPGRAAGLPQDRHPGGSQRRGHREGGDHGAVRRTGSGRCRGGGLTASMASSSAFVQRRRRGNPARLPVMVVLSGRGFT